MEPTKLTRGHPFVGMPAHDTQFEVMRWGGKSWGVIRCGGECRDDYRRITIAHSKDGAATVKLQQAAVESFLAASADVGHFIHCTGSWRACADQARYYASDRVRYAPPNATAHTRGLAIDVTTAYPAAQQVAIREALLKRHWHQARPDDEPWHYSFGIQV